jgi:rubrerythrin
MESPAIVSIVHRAMDRERDAIQSYLDLAKVVKDASAKNVLIHLASDEVGHLTKLERHLVSVLQGKDWVLQRAEVVDAMAAQMTESSLLEQADAREIAVADTLRILEIAIDREIAANRFYLQMADGAATDAARKMFLGLAKEEDLHSRILRAEVDAIGRNGFWFDMQEFTMEK